MDRPRLLDLFCGAGGAARGYQRAGFRVTGVDIKPQPRYAGNHFCQADIMDVGLDALLRELGPFDAIHASPPCQAFSRARTRWNRTHPDSLTPLRPHLDRTPLPWVIENVPGAPMRGDIVLCGTMFGLDIRRHRLFELSWRGPALAPATCDHSRRCLTLTGHGSSRSNGSRWPHWTADDGREAMGVPWMTRDELSQAIPPAYTEWIGRQLMAHLEARGA